MGTLANPPLRRARAAAHYAFDPIWKRRHMSRTSAYHWLAKQLGLKPGQCHIGEFDEAMCVRVIEACKTFSPSKKRPAA